MITTSPPRALPAAQKDAPAWPPTDKGIIEFWAESFLAVEDARFWFRSEPKRHETHETDPGSWEEDEAGETFFAVKHDPERVAANGNVIVSVLMRPAWATIAKRYRRVLFEHEEDEEFVWSHVLVHADGAEEDLAFDGGSAMFRPNAEAYLNLLHHGFEPSPDWLMVDSFEGDEIRVIDAIRIKDGIADGDVNALRAALARRIVAAAPDKLPSRTVVHDGALYLCRDDWHVVLLPTGEWRSIECMSSATTPRLAPDVARNWLALGAPQASELLGDDAEEKLLRASPAGAAYLDLPTATFLVMQELNCPPSPPGHAKVLVRLALSDRWPMEPTESA